MIGLLHQRRHHDERGQEGHRDVDGDHHAEVGQQRERAEHQHREASERGECRGEERSAGAQRRHARAHLRVHAAFAFLRVAVDQEHRELGAGGHHQRSADGGERAQCDAEQTNQHCRRTHCQEHRNHRQQTAGEIAIAQHHEGPHQQQGHDGEFGAVGGDVLEQAHAHDREPTGGGTGVLGQRGTRPRIGDGALHVVEHHRALLQRRRAHLEQHLRGIALVRHHQPLQAVASSMSRPSGGSAVVSGTSMSQPTVVARLDACASSLFCASWLLTRSSWNAPI